MIQRVSIVSRLASLASLAALAALLACSGDDMSSPVTPDPEAALQPAIQPHPMNANARDRSGDRALSPAAAIISNGTVQLGVHDQGHLNIPGGTPSNGTSSTTVVGLRFVPINTEATAPGCLCEGWGVADAGTGQFGNASVDTGGIDNLVVNSFVSTATTAVSDVTAFGRLRVVHDYHPSTTPFLYEVIVTIENISDTPVSDLRYTRGMDWDIPPNTFSEFVTIQGTAAATGIPGVLLANNNGFNDVNPLAPHPSIGFSGDFVDAGPNDHGAHFDFRFGALAPGATRTFRTFYGAAGNEPTALAALAAVGAEVYSFGQANCSNCAAWVPAPGAGHTQGTEGATTGVPNTFIFAFAGVGGVPIDEPPPVGAACPLGGRTPNLTGTEFFGIVFFNGTEGNDVAVGVPNKRNVFLMKGGDDFACGANLEDTFFGGTGDDEWHGLEKRDIAFGHQGNDILDGGSGFDRNDGGHTPVPSSVVDADHDICSIGDENYLCEEEVSFSAPAPSSVRFKSEVTPLLSGGRSVLGLRPVVFRYREPYGDPAILRFGLIAEEVAQSYPEAVVFDRDGKPWALRYDVLAARLVTEVGRQSGHALREGVTRLTAAVTSEI